jgi:preprotein translocase subunit SecG
MQTVLLVAHLIIAIGLIGVVLLQRSEGGALGIGSGGGGGGGNLFSARGVGNALTRTTAWLAVAFFATSITLTVLATRSSGDRSVFGEGASQTQSEESTIPVDSGEGTGGTILPQLPETPKVPVTQ